MLCTERRYRSGVHSRSAGDSQSADAPTEPCSAAFVCQPDRNQPNEWPVQISDLRRHEATEDSVRARGLWATSVQTSEIDSLTAGDFTEPKLAIPLDTSLVSAFM